ncbi:lysostaphin resistance A-like protein [Mariniluteicoccus flavus]
MTTTLAPAAVTAPNRTLRHVALFYALAYAGMLAVTLPFADSSRAYPEWLTLVGRWIPAVASLIAIALLGPGSLRRLVHWWGLRPGGWRPLALGVVATLAALLAVAFAPVLVGQALGWVQLKPWSIVGGALALLPVYVLIGSLSTLGEEVAWRGFLPRLLGEGARFWPVALVVAALWSLWHVPQLAMFVARGDLPAHEAVAAGIGIAFWSLALSSLAFRFGSVWPAVVGHALPFRAGSLVVAQPADSVPFWAFAALEWALYAGVAVVVASTRWRSLSQR